MTYLIVEARDPQGRPVELRTEGGLPSGNCRGWLEDAGDVAPPLHLIARAERYEEMVRAVEEGRRLLCRKGGDG